MYVHPRIKINLPATQMASSNSGVVTLKLLIDSNREKVLFAEGGKDFVDFLFTLLSLPVGTVTRLLSKTAGMVGSIGNLYKSVENLDYTYFQPSVQKDSLLIPKSLVSSGGPNILKLTTNSNNVNSTTSRKVLYFCGSKTTYRSYDDVGSVHPYVTTNRNEKCPACSNPMNRVASCVGEANSTEEISDDAEADGYVKGVVTYMITDNLEVTPMSAISSITMLKKFDIKDVGALEEKVVELTMHEGVKLLKESLESQSVLTNVFLGKKTPT